MITPTEKKIITTTLGYNWTGQILAHLTKKKVFTDNGNPFSQPSLSQFMNGHRENVAVEMEILKLVAKVKAKKEKQLRDRKNLLKK